jgi:site-specific recombinase XerD
METTIAGNWGTMYREHLDNRAKLTWQAYLSDLSIFIEYFELVNGGTKFSPELITKHDLIKWQREAIVLKLSPATINRRRVSIRIFCQWALKQGLILSDPSLEMQIQEEVKQAPRWMEQAEAGRFIRYSEQMVNLATTDHWRWQAQRDQAMINLMLFAGLREMEVVLLDHGDVVLGERSGKVVIRQGKGGKRRVVPLNVDARRALGEWIHVRGESEGPLFTSKHGSRIGARSIQKMVSEIGRICKIEDLTPHRLRHTFAKMALDKGVQITVISSLLGHSRLETTAIYTRPGWEDLEQAVERL